MKKLILLALVLLICRVHGHQGAREWSRGCVGSTVNQSRSFPVICGDCDRVLRVRVTVYWRSGGESDYCTRRGLTSTGLPLIDGESVAVDPAVIPYGSKVAIPGYGTARAVDTGSDVVSRKASRLVGSRDPVIDLYFDDRFRAEKWADSHPMFLDARIF